MRIFFFPQYKLWVGVEGKFPHSFEYAERINVELRNAVLEPLENNEEDLIGAMMRNLSLVAGMEPEYVKIGEMQ